jgi:murein L,D-transpeptidase YafK
MQLISRIIMLCILSAPLLSGPLAATGPAEFEIEIHKANRMLLIKQGSTVTRSFPVSFGRGGHGDKHRLGDRKTPEGVYRIVRINENSAFYTFMQLNYPNVKDAFFGLKDNLISRAEFDRIVDAVNHDSVPPQHTRLGGAIGIHGLGVTTEQKLSIHSNLDWTQGCIALTNSEVAELRKYVGVGTKVVITE